MSKSLKKLIDINRLREFKNKLVGTDSAYVQTTAVDQTIAGTKTFSKPIVGSVTGSSGSCTGNAATATTATTAKACTGNAATANIATKATQDAAGNTITTTYATKAENNTKANNSEVVHKSGDETIAGTKTFSNGVLSTDPNALMAQNGEYTLVLRNDSYNTYLLMSDKGGVPGTWSAAKPLKINNPTGVCSINGNAATATKLAAKRTIALSGAATGTATGFDGSGNITIPVTSLDASKLTGTASVSTTGNAATATQFSANATVALTGDATGTSAGSKKGWSVPVTLANSGVTAGTYGPSADVTGNNNATISVPQITVDAKGRVTSVTNRTLTCKNNTYTVNNATLTIQKNGTNVATFTSNASSNATANITVPTKVSELTNDSGFLTSKSWPAGVIIPFAGKSVPTGYLLCNGAAVSRTNYANLFAAIGTLYGAGNGSTTFNLPDARDRVLQGASGGHSAGSYIAAGLPNITGNMEPMYWRGASSTGAMNGVANNNNVAGPGGDAMGQVDVTFNASRSSSYYGASTKPQVDAIATNFIIKY